MSFRGFVGSWDPLFGAFKLASSHPRVSSPRPSLRHSRRLTSLCRGAAEVLLRDRKKAPRELTIVTRSNNLHACKSGASALLSAAEVERCVLFYYFTGGGSLAAANQEVLTAMHLLVKPITACFSGRSQPRPLFSN